MVEMNQHHRRFMADHQSRTTTAITRQMFSKRFLYYATATLGFVLLTSVPHDIAILSL
jgi:hypothetical protein